MKINKQIFKEYDIRGKYPEEINEDIYFEIGATFARILKNNHKDSQSYLLKNQKKIIVGRDMRKSSPNLSRAFSNGVLSEGIGVDYIGLSSTPALYWAEAKKEYAGGAMITASHNPSSYNGIKLCSAKARPFDPQDLLRELELNDAGKRIFFGKNAQHSGILQRKSFAEEYIKFVKKFYFAGSRHLKVVIDAAWGMASDEIPFLLNGLNIDFIPICFGPAENFSNKDINPSNKGALDDLSKCIKKYKADIGVAFDGDADRVLFMNEKGDLIDPEIITILIASLNSSIRRQNNTNSDKKDKKRAAEAKIILDARAGRQSGDPLKKMGFEVIISRSGHSNIKEAMKSRGAIFGAETSGHYYFDIGRNIPSDNAMIAMLKILSVLSASDKNISAIAKRYDKFFKSIELNFKSANADKITKNIESYYLESLRQQNKKTTVSRLDGITMDFKIWRFNLRGSNTENKILRLNIEAKNENLLREKIKEMKKLIAPLS